VHRPRLQESRRIIHRYITVKMQRLLLVLVVCSVLAGCGDPQLYPVTGKVTLGGKPYDRLLVYFHPIDQKPSRFTIGVGETSKDGVLTLRSTAGNGLAAGKYRVSFQCYVVQGSSKQSVGLASDKPDDDRSLVTKDIVPEPYGSAEDSPVEFEIRSDGDNRFSYDIPSG